MDDFRPDPYSPCPCGSGKKYKFCCRAPDRRDMRTFPASLGAEVDGKPIIVADLAEGEALQERGLRAMHAGRYEEATRLFEASIRCAEFVPNPHNNLALMRYVTGDLAGARREAELVAQSLDPENLFALGLLVQFDLFEGRRDEARRIAERMVPLPLRTEYFAVRKAEAFARLRWHERVLDTVSEGLTIAEEQAPTLAWFAGVALANLGRYAEAAERLRGVPGSSPRADRAKRYLSLLERNLGPGSLGGDWPYLVMAEWISPGLVDRARREDRVRRAPGMVDAVRASLEDDPDNDDAIDMLEKIDTEEARALLRLIAHGTFGTDRFRLAALAALRELGEGDGPQAFWTQGEWRETGIHSMELTEEAATPLPEEMRDEMRQMLEAMHARDLPRAEGIGRDLLARAPQALSVLSNLGSTVWNLGKEEEAERCILKALEIDPSYLIARAALVEMRLQQKRVDDACRLVREVVLPSRVHPAAYAQYLHAVALLALEQDDLEGYEHAAEWVKKLAPDSVGARDLEKGARVSRFAMRYLRRREPMRRRLLPPDPSHMDCLERHTRSDLFEAAGWIGLDGVSALPKHPLAREVSRAVLESPTLDDLVSAGTVLQRTALLALLDRGGRMPFVEFTRNFGAAESENSPLSRWGRLALVAEGTIGGEEVVVVPVELRGPLRDALAARAARVGAR